MPDIAIIIPHYNDVVRLERCLAALTANDLAGCEVIVVDNGSTRPLDGVRAGFPDVRFVTEPEKGAAAARNRGVRETTAPRLMFIDADCVAAPDWVRVGRAVADRADLVGGRVEVFDETPPPRSGAEAFEAVFAFDFRHYIEVQGFSGTGNLITRRDVFEDVGPFRGGVSEDRDWSFRATARGYRLIYEDGLRVGHPSRRDWPALRGKWRRITQEMFGQTGGGAGARLKWALKGLMMPVSILAHLPRVLRSPALSGPRERWRAALTLIRLRFTRMVWMLRQAVGREI
ncbi:glycosyltransferase family 2 protein [Roseovarius spongiae]|uniref:Glycosyltransferase family 2 protein n=1 Tax=Roseovarius spongiae TaxID=2320272 RepID=A0A3A8B1J0_9RHOB|nr:glycosyltransferase family 2 protein [Roseovarius spongiae]RKF12390.1 glycosyltransferase family 2 protein [Roseovarius spongiae]